MSCIYQQHVLNDTYNFLPPHFIISYALETLKSKDANAISFYFTYTEKVMIVFMPWVHIIIICQ